MTLDEQRLRVQGESVVTFIHSERLIHAFRGGDLRAHRKRETAEEFSTLLQIDLLGYHFRGRISIPLDKQIREGHNLPSSTSRSDGRDRFHRLSDRSGVFQFTIAIRISYIDW